MLTGQAKTDYQREYMRRRRSNERNPNVLDPDVELSVAVRPALDPAEEGMKRIGFDPVGVDTVGFKVGESVRDRLARTPLAELEQGGSWIPNWRVEQGHNP